MRKLDIYEKDFHSYSIYLEKNFSGISEKLKELDEVAYVRFASVYREFKDVNTFVDEISKLLKK